MESCQEVLAHRNHSKTVLVITSKERKQIQKGEREKSSPACQRPIILWVPPLPGFTYYEGGDRILGEEGRVQNQLTSKRVRRFQTQQ